MHIHPNFDPIAIHLGPLAVRWYGLMYLVAFILAIVVGRLRLRLPYVAAQGWTAKDIDDMLFYGVLGTIFGGRLGYVLFYKADYYFAHPLDIFKVWEGGMSFHGGFLGVTLAMLLFAYQRGRSWLQVTDFVAPMVPTGLAAGRLGNFINGELWGRVADPSLPWAMAFPQSGSMVPRHPSQIYQFLGEGIALFLILWIYGKKERGLGQVSGLFLMGYGFFRFVAEYFREPDNFIGDSTTLVGNPATHLLAFNWSEGQWLCVPMLIAGALLFAWGAKRRPLVPAQA
jgi:phosphatidylglycerol---prolipoprotein diacylglyceryl transferase